MMWQTGGPIQRIITVLNISIPRASGISAMWTQASRLDQKGSDHLRMARRNLDGYRLYEDMIQTDPSKKRLSDLFDASQIFDASRPTPVTWSYTQNEAAADASAPAAPETVPSESAASQ